MVEERNLWISGILLTVLVLTLVLSLVELVGAI